MKIKQEAGCKQGKRITPTEHQMDLTQQRNFEICSQENWITLHKGERLFTQCSKIKTSNQKAKNPTTVVINLGIY